MQTGCVSAFGPVHRSSALPTVIFCYHNGCPRSWNEVDQLSAGGAVVGVRYGVERAQTLHGHIVERRG